LCNIIRRVFPGESLSEESLAVPYHGYDSLLRGFPSRPPHCTLEGTLARRCAETQLGRLVIDHSITLSDKSTGAVVLAPIAW
jgi:hypothetical protein